jgi:hypothetical protein
LFILKTGPKMLDKSIHDLSLGARARRASGALWVWTGKTKRLSGLLAPVRSILAAHPNPTATQHFRSIKIGVEFAGTVAPTILTRSSLSLTLHRAPVSKKKKRPTLQWPPRPPHGPTRRCRAAPRPSPTRARLHGAAAMWFVFSR